MDSSTKIARAIVLAAVVLLVGFIAYHEFERQRDIKQESAAIENFNETARQVAAQSQADEAHRLVHDAQRRDVLLQRKAAAMQSRELAPSQRCVGGVVVVVSGNVYTELGRVGDPVRCADGYADRPLR